MSILYGICAVVGFTVLVCQFAMTIMGLASDAEIADDVPDNAPDDVGHDFAHDGGHHGAEHHHGSTWFFGVVTFRTIVAALAFFGLTGLAAEASDLPSVTTLVVAVAAGLGAMYAVHWLMQLLYRLRAEGNVRIERAVGQLGTVYLKIPGGRQGAGKVHLNLQNRTVELLAVSSEAELPTGARIMVTRVVGPDTVEVQPAAISEGMTHA